VDQRTIRASDNDRERTIAALQEHTVAGRLTLDEFTERAASVYAARTLSELAETTADLPVAKPKSDARHLAISFLIAIAVVAVLGAMYLIFT
jgi:hypothetical protein